MLNLQLLEDDLHPMDFAHILTRRLETSVIATDIHRRILNVCCDPDDEVHFIGKLEELGLKGRIEMAETYLFPIAQESSDQDREHIELKSA